MVYHPLQQRGQAGHHQPLSAIVQLGVLSPLREGVCCGALDTSTLVLRLCALQNA